MEAKLHRLYAVGSLIVIMALLSVGCAPARATQPAIIPPLPSPTSMPTTEPAATPIGPVVLCQKLKRGEPMSKAINRMLVGGQTTVDGLKTAGWVVAACAMNSQVETRSLEELNLNVPIERYDFACAASDSGSAALGAGTKCKTR